MRVSEILRQITEEARILETHFESGSVDPEFLQSHADNLVAYGLLLRDMHLPKHPIGALSSNRSGGRMERHFEHAADV